MNEPWKNPVWRVPIAGIVALALGAGRVTAQGAAGDSTTVPAASRVEAARSAGGDSAGAALPPDLAASTEPPWVPERPVPSERPWETAVRMPGRILTLPLSGLGYVTEHTLLTIEQTNFVNRVRVTFEPIPRAGFRVTTASLGDRTGFGLGIAFSPPVVKRHLVVRWEGSTLKYNRTTIEASDGPARLGWQYDWRPRERFYGIGPSSSEADESDYATQSQSVRLGLVQQITRDREKDSPRWTLGAFVGPRELITRRGREAEDPSFEEIFPSLVPFLDRRVEHLVYGGMVELDHRRGKPHWAEGGRTSVEVERFDRPVEALALRTSHTPFRYTRWTYEAEGGASFYREPRTFRLQLQVVDNVPDASGSILPSELATLGGGHGLYGFAPGRFHDNDSVLGRLSYIFPVAFRLEIDAHVEAGQVAHDVWKDTSIGTLEHSFGVGLRPRFGEAVLGLIGVDWGRESMRVRFSVGGVE